MKSFLIFCALIGSCVSLSSQSHYVDNELFMSKKTDFYKSEKVREIRNYTLCDDKRVLDAITILDDSFRVVKKIFGKDILKKDTNEIITVTYHKHSDTVVTRVDDIYPNSEDFFDEIYDSEMNFVKMANVAPNGHMVLVAKYIQPTKWPVAKEWFFDGTFHKDRGALIFWFPPAIDIDSLGTPKLNLDRSETFFQLDTVGNEIKIRVDKNTLSATLAIYENTFQSLTTYSDLDTLTSTVFYRKDHKVDYIVTRSIGGQMHSVERFIYDAYGKLSSKIELNERDNLIFNYNFHPNAGKDVASIVESYSYRDGDRCLISRKYLNYSGMEMKEEYGKCHIMNQYSEGKNCGWEIELVR